MKKKEIQVFIILMGIVIGIILLINFFRGNGNHDEETMQCIADNSLLIISRTCTACSYQKNNVLGEYFDLFETIDIIDHPEVWEEYNLEGVPTWIINGEKYPGVRTISQLKELTGCE